MTHRTVLENLQFIAGKGYSIKATLKMCITVIGWLRVRNAQKLVEVQLPSLRRDHTSIHFLSQGIMNLHTKHLKQGDEKYRLSWCFLYPTDHADILGIFLLYNQLKDRAFQVTQPNQMQMINLTIIIVSQWTIDLFQNCGYKQHCYSVCSIP